MGNYEQLKQSVSDVIKTNGNQEITGSILQNVLLTIISSVGANATFVGIATPTTNPGTPDGPVFYLASESGTYPNFNAIELQAGLSVLMWNSSWSSQQIFSIDDIPTAGSDNLVKSGGVYAAIENGVEKITDVQRFGTEQSDDEISFEDEDGNTILSITPEGVSAVNLANNGKSLNVVSYLSESGCESEDEVVYSNNTETDTYLTIGDYGIKTKGVSDFYNYPFSIISRFSILFQNVLCIGDSLTAGDFGSYPEGTANMHPPYCYPYYLSKITGCEVDNKGRNGASAITWWANDKSRVDTTKNFDCVYIYLGTNDGNLNGDIDTLAPGDDYANYDVTKSLGAYCAIVAWIKETFPSAMVFLVNFPIGRRGKTWSETISAQLTQIAEKFSVPIIDMLNKSPFRQDDGRMYRPVGMDDEIAATGTSNGNLHYGKLGYMVFAQYIAYLTSELIYNNKINYSL